MNSRILRSLFAALAVTSLAACGGNGDPLVTAAPAALTAPAPASMPVASSCNEPSCLGRADGLADQFRTASMERAALVQDGTPPGYPNVPVHAVVMAETRAPELLGTATLQRAQ